MRHLTPIALVVTLAGCASPLSANAITLAKYNQLANGMTYEEATTILGAGTEVSRSGSGESEAIMYSWKNPDGSNMVAMFQGGKLTTKSQFGLK